MPQQDDFATVRAQLGSQIRSIHQSHPGNLMARHFDEDTFAALSDAQQERFLKIIRSGLDNPESEIGVYAQHIDDCHEFAALLDPMIREFHGFSKDSELKQLHNWGLQKRSCDLSDIAPELADLSMRVRVGRNLSDFPLPGAMTKSERLALETRMIEIFATLQTDPAFGGQYLSLSPGSPCKIDAAEFKRRVDAHQMFKVMSGDRYLVSAGIAADWPYGRGVYISEAEDFLVWVGEEDQLRVMAMMRGGNLARLFSRLHDGLERLSELLPPFAHSDRYGFITSCPTNLGTAMRASLHLPLPNLTKNGTNLGPVKEAASALGLAVRGADGEHSDVGHGGIVDIYPRTRMGVTECEIMHSLYDGVAALWALEKSAT